MNKRSIFRFVRLITALCVVLVVVSCRTTSIPKLQVGMEVQDGLAILASAGGVDISEQVQILFKQEKGYNHRRTRWYRLPDQQCLVVRSGVRDNDPQARDQVLELYYAYHDPASMKSYTKFTTITDVYLSGHTRKEHAQQPGP